MLTPFCVALQFLTRIPVAVSALEPRDVRRAALYFPVVGALIGLVLWAAHTLASALFPPLLARSCVLAAGVVLTGALHLDALCDTADGFFASRERQRILDVMRDPHVGAIGTVTVALTLLLKQAALVSLSPSSVGPVLIAGAIASRSILLAALFLPPARGNGFGFANAQHVSPAPLLSCTLGSMLAPLVLLGTPALPALLLAAIASGALLCMAYRRLGGMTGDVCGAAGELAETGFWIGASCIPWSGSALGAGAG